MSSTQKILEVSNLGVQFGGIKALQGVSFDVTRGSITAIIGPNGAGKTTVFNCLTGFYQASAGQILLQTQHKTHDVIPLLKTWFGGSHTIAARGVARTFQNIRLFNDMTVVENLLVAQHNHLNRNIIQGFFKTKAFKDSEAKAVEKAFQWLDIMDLTDAANRLAGELPYGSQRRLEIARAMCTGAELVCLDEPAAGLNHKETDALSKLIMKLKNEHNVTVLVIEHDMALVMEVSDYIIVLDHGEVIAHGKPQDIKSNPKVIAAYLGEEA